MQTSTTTLMLILSTFIPVFGIILAATPYLTPTSECFAVTIPTAQSHDHTLATYRRLYCGIMVACTAAMTATCVAAACLDPTHAFLACFIVGMLALIILGYILMLVFRAKVQHISSRNAVGGHSGNAPLRSSGRTETFPIPSRCGGICCMCRFSPSHWRSVMRDTSACRNISHCR